ncbi:A/G-specific adenine glycosylase, partial [Candidatus Berkelbacteria bacterium]|nr:A/G-specific adenine glycosylase [Candidatus Berkelbacteria bacterium]
MNQDITTLRAFRRQILQYYRAHKRDFPWRRTDNPYHILISEVMLQQTQAPRVVAKYNEFITTFPTIQALAKAPIEKLLRVWQGLGYNRRALALRKLAQIAAAEHGGTLPNDYEQLLALPGVGQSTAGAVLAFGYNNPMPFIETNIRRVYLHFFFPERDQVSDRQLLPLIKATLDRSQARRWYFALMDYGAMLAHETPINPNRRSRSYHRQSRFEGS